MQHLAVSPSSYDNTFYEAQQEGSLRSAKHILPFILKRFNIASAVDVGCGVGTWLSVLQDCGVDDILGLDGDYVERGMLKIPESRFVPTNFHTGVPIERTFDLALCLEVAEHLPSDVGDRLIGHLTSLAPIVLFSAAIPGQGGTEHINEQWQDYWRTRFAARGFRAVDFIRPQIWGHASVEWWYQQNIICYCKVDTIDRFDLTPVGDGITLNLVHPIVYERTRDEARMYLSKAFTILPSLVAQAVRNRFSG